MKTVLFAWELGAGLGHAAPLVALARTMVSRNDGIRPVFVFRDTIYPRSLLAGHDWPVLPAPLLPVLGEPRTGDASHAQLLMSAGFNRPPDLAATLRTWDDIFSTVRPDLIVAEHSPFACLAARGRYPLLVTGTSFTVPPADTNMFLPFRRGVEPPALQTRMVTVINGILVERGQPPLQHLPQLLAGDARAIFSLPHLDPYGELRHDRLLGPYNERLPPTPVPEAPRIYLYGNTHQKRLLDSMVEVLLGLDVPITAYITGPDDTARMMLRNRGATVHDDPPDLAEVLSKARLVISHGGAGVTTAALTMGRAQLIAPIHVESEVTAARVAALGSALFVEPFDAGAFRQAIDTIMQVRLFHEHAERIAQEITELDLPDDPLAEAATLAEGLL